MKFKIKQLSIVLIVVLYSCLINYHLTAELRNSNSNLITNSNTSSAQTKTSIFEGFKAFSQNTSKINITKGKAQVPNPFARLMGEKAAGQVMDSEMKRLGIQQVLNQPIDWGSDFYKGIEPNEEWKHNVMMARMLMSENLCICSQASIELMRIW